MQEGFIAQGEQRKEKTLYTNTGVYRKKLCEMRVEDNGNREQIYTYRGCWGAAGAAGQIIAGVLENRPTELMCHKQ